jgi:hypothetical protein
MKWPGKVVLVGLSLFVALALAWLALGSMVVAWAQKRADDRWAEGFEPMSAFVARFPRCDASPAALRLNELTIALGFPMIAGRRGEADPVLKVAREYVRSGSVASTDASAAIPGPVEDYLAAHERELTVVESHLRVGGAVAWEQDATKGTGAPIPPIGRVLDLNAIVLCRALQAERRGDLEGTARALDASWSLRTALHARPETISLLGAEGLASQQYGVLRYLRRVPSAWSGRLREYDFRDGVLLALQGEAWWFSRLVAEQVQAPGARGTGARLGRGLSGQYMGLCAANYSGRLHGVALSLKNERRACSAEGLPEGDDGWLPRWNALGRIASPNVRRLWRGAVEASLDAELTGLAIRAKARQRDGAAEPLPAVVASEVCPGMRWTIDTAADGSVRIAADPKPFEGEQTQLVTSFTVLALRSE